MTVVVEFGKKVDRVHSCIFCMKNCSKSTAKNVVTMQRVEGMSDKNTACNFYTHMKHHF